MRGRWFVAALVLVPTCLGGPTPQGYGVNGSAAWGNFQGDNLGKTPAPGLGTKVLAWVRNNLKSGNPKFHNAVVADIKDALKAKVDFSYTFGPNATKDGRAKMFHVFGGRFYSFNLSGTQGRKAVSSPGSAFGSRSGPVKYQRQTPLSARLSKVRIDKRKALDGTAKTTGEVHFQTLKELPPDTCLRLTYRVGKTTTAQFNYRYYEGSPPADGKVWFSFPPIIGDKDKKEDDRAKGPLVVFLDLCTVDKNTAEVKVHSNTLATLVDVLEP